MRQLDKQLHDKIHEGMMRQDPQKIFGPRVRVFPEFESITRTRITGEVLDIGCGNGYAAIWLAKNRPVSKVVALEASDRAVAELLPRNVEAHGVAALVEPRLGQFDSIPDRERFDFVVAFGALHHSRCLFSTMKSIVSCLKPGGFVIAQEPAMPNTTKHGDYVAKYNLVEERYGIRIRNGDRDDHFFREAEYIAAAVMSGLDLVYSGDFVPDGMLGTIRRTLSTLKSKAVRKFSKNGTTHSGPDIDPAVAKHLRSVSRKVFFFRKSEVEEIPHLWRPLR